MAEVKKRYPESVRIILSGYSEEESIMRTIGPTHQYYAKPCGADEIVALLERTYALHMELVDPKLRRQVAGLHTLPTPPDLYLRLTEEIQKESSSLRGIAGMIAEDVAMTAEVLRITNSGYFALGSPVHDVFQAIRLLGLETIRALVLSVGIFKKSEHHSELEGLLNEIEVYCLLVASQSRHIAQMLELSESLQEQAFCAGMLSCVGTLILMDAHPDKLRTLFSRVMLDECFSDVEDELFGTSQAKLGAYLLGLWGFSEVVVEAVLYHDHPSDCVFRDHSALTCVHLARALGPDLTVTDNASVRPILLDEVYTDSLGLTSMIKAGQLNSIGMV